MKTRFILLAASMFPILFAPAFAQENAGDLQEIVVTAQRQAQSSMQVPLSVQAFSGQELHNQSVTTFTDLEWTTPGYLPNTASGFTEIYIRGIGNDIYTGADPSVATFIDDVPHIWGSSTDSLLNVERVEVLKGAQGGLYGRNATGGVVNVITRQPNTEKFESDSLLDYGEKNTLRAASYANFPLNDMIAINVSAERDHQNAYIPNDAPAAPYTAAMFPTGSFIGGTPQATANLLNSFQHVAPVDNRNFWATDDKLLLKLSDNFKITVAGDFEHKDDTVGQGYYKLTPAVTQEFDTGLLTAFGFNPNLPPGLESSGNGRFTTSLGDNLINYIQEMGGSVTALWNAPSVDVTSISAYRQQQSTFASGAAAGTLSTVGVDVNNQRNYWYQELRAISTWHSPLQLIGGATYLDSNFVGNLALPIFDGLASSPPVHSTDAVHNWSVYLQATYDITHDLDLIVSGRYVHETNHARFTSPTVAGNDAVEDKFLPSATLSYKLEDGNVYARFARGWKAGGLNPTAAPVYFPNPNDGSVFGPEQVDTYEVGYRQALFDRKVQLTTAVFYNDYRDVQFSDHANAEYATDVILAIVNGGNARTWGAEEELAWRVINPLTVGVSAGYLNAKYTNFGLKNNPVLADFDLSGQTMLDAPTWQLNFTGDIDQPLNDKLHFVSHVLVTHISSVLYYQSGEPGVVPPAEGPAYWLTNLRVGVRTSDGKYGFAVFANNLFNQAYYVWGNSATTGTFVAWGDPRIIGGEITAKF